MINIFNWQYFFSCRLWFLDASQARWSFLLKHICEVMTTKKWCNSLWIVELSTLWYVSFQPFFLKLLFPWTLWIYFFFPRYIQQSVEWKIQGRSFNPSGCRSGVGKELLQISLLLLTHRQNYRWYSVSDMLYLLIEIPM